MPEIVMESPELHITDDLQPEQRARRVIDHKLRQAGWIIQNYREMNLGAGRAIAVREFPTATGTTDYLLYVDRKAIGTVEAKREGDTLRGVETQADRYAKGFSQTAEEQGLPFWGDPLPFHYITTGTETLFTSRRDPIVRPREVFHFHQPDRLVHWLQQGSLRQGVCDLPPLSDRNLRQSQIEAITGLEESLRDDRPRALVEMTVGGGKTIAAVAHAYRLLRFGNCERVLFLVDRRNLGIQARDEFVAWQTPDDGRKFGELYPVQLLTSNTIDPSSKVVITTIQRLYSMLKGEEKFDAEREDISAWEAADVLQESVQVSYEPKVPIEEFDYIVIDECHRSIYGRWGQVLDYFDSHLIGLTATAAPETYGFFSVNIVGEGKRPNVVSEYSYDRSVVDGINVDYVVYRIKTKITDRGGKVEAGEWVEVRDKQTRARSREELVEDLGYDENKLDSAVVVPDQIRTVVRAFREAIPVLLPGRQTVPKTVVFCKDDSHAEDVLEIIRQGFGKGSDFARKITYKTQGSSQQAIQDFRTDPRFRIAVTVDQISTGTDIKPIECLLFLRRVKSALLFEQMRGRGVRTIDPHDLKAVTPDAEAKTHFVLVDAVGITDDDVVWKVSPPMDRKPTVPLSKLLQSIAMGATSVDLLKTVSARLNRLNKVISEEQQEALERVTGGRSLREIAENLVEATEEKTWIEKAGADAVSDGVEVARQEIITEALEGLTSPEAREAILGLQRQVSQVIDHQSQDQVVSAGVVDDARARQTINGWQKFIDEHHDEYLALAAYYREPHSRRPSLRDIKELAQAISLPPYNLTPELLWQAYEKIDKSRVKSAGGRQLVDLVSLIRFAMQKDDELAPHSEVVRLRYEMWLMEQEQDGRRFTPEQRRWLDMIAEQIASSLSIEREDFTLDPFRHEGGIFRASEIFGEELAQLLADLNDSLAVG
ncbi:MAG TPA: type I restriction-modification enzyme R subunit C-terminal domain-containing protein [Solirubrobacterales bacterium]